MAARFVAIFILGLFAILSLLGVLRSKPSQVAWIAFASTRTTGVSQLYRMSSEGSHVQQLSYNLDLANSRSYIHWISPHEVLVSSYCCEDRLWRFDILKNEISASKPKRLSLSPNKKWLMIDYGEYIQLLDATTGKTKNFPMHNGGVYWANNSHWLLLIDQNPTNDRKSMILAKPDGSSFKRVLLNWDMRNASLSPDSNWILFLSAQKGNDDIYRIRPDGNDLQQLTHTAEDEQEPIWSPDSHMISYKRDNIVYVMEANGEAQQPVFSLKIFKPHYTWEGGGKLNAQAYYRDRTYIVGVGFHLARFVPYSISYYYGARVFYDQWVIFSIDDVGQRNLFSENLATGEIYQLTHDIFREVEYSWSPDGQWIVFESHATGGADIYKVRRDGTELTNLTNHPDWDIKPAWSPTIDLAWHPQYLGAFGGVLSGVLIQWAYRRRKRSERHVG